MQAAQQRGAGQGSSRAGRGGRRPSCRSKEGDGRRRRVGAIKGLRWASGWRSGEGDLDERAMVAGEEDKRASQDEDSATELLSCLLLDFEIC